MCIDVLVQYPVSMEGGVEDEVEGGQPRQVAASGSTFLKRRPPDSFPAVCPLLVSMDIFCKYAG